MSDPITSDFNVHHSSKHPNLTSSSTVVPTLSTTTSSNTSDCVLPTSHPPMNSPTKFPSPPPPSTIMNNASLALFDNLVKWAQWCQKIEKCLGISLPPMRTISLFKVATFSEPDADDVHLITSENIAAVASAAAAAAAATVPNSSKITSPTSVAAQIGCMQYAKAELDLISRDFQAISQCISIAASTCRRPPQSPDTRSAILDEALNLMEPYRDPESLVLQVLRFVGNVCADNDPLRSVAMKYYTKFAICLQRPDLRDITFAVLFNICNEYSPAKSAFFEAGLCTKIVGLLAADYANKIPLTTPVNLLCIIFEIDQPDGTNNLVKQTACSKLVQNLVTVLSKQSLFPEDYSSLLELTLIYISRPDVQKCTVEAGLFMHVSQLLFRHVDFLNELESLGPQKLEEISADLDMKFFRSAKPRIMEILCNITIEETISSESLFTSDSFIIGETMIRDHREDIVCCGCLILGNLARSDEFSIEMVRKSTVHNQIISLFFDMPQKYVAHSAAGFLRHLAIAPSNKAIFGALGCIDISLKCIETSLIDLIDCGFLLLIQLLKANTPNVMIFMSMSPRMALNPPLTPFEEVMSLVNKYSRRFDRYISRILAQLVKCLHEKKATSPVFYDLVMSQRVVDVLFVNAVEIEREDYLSFMEIWFSLTLFSTFHEGAVMLLDALRFSSNRLTPLSGSQIVKLDQCLTISPAELDLTSPLNTCRYPVELSLISNDKSSWYKTSPSWSSFITIIECLMINEDPEATSTDDYTSTGIPHLASVEEHDLDQSSCRSNDRKTSINLDLDDEDHSSSACEKCSRYLPLPNTVRWNVKQNALLLISNLLKKLGDSINCDEKDSLRQLQTALLHSCEATRT